MEYQRIELMHKALLICGILSSILYVAMNIFVPVFYDGYSSSSQTVSELSAIGAPTKRLWIFLGTAYAFLIIAFAFGVWKSAGQNKYLKILGNLLTAYGIISLLWLFAPMGRRQVLAN